MCSQKTIIFDPDKQNFGLSKKTKLEIPIKLKLDIDSSQGFLNIFLVGYEGPKRGQRQIAQWPKLTPIPYMFLYILRLTKGKTWRVGWPDLAHRSPFKNLWLTKSWSISYCVRTVKKCQKLNIQRTYTGDRGFKMGAAGYHGVTVFGRNTL